MAIPPFSVHATIRAQQRGIPHWIAGLLCQEGVRSPAGNGMLKLHFNARARQRIRQRAEKGEFPIGKLDPFWASYLVMTRDHSQVVTIGHLNGRRIWRR